MTVQENATEQNLTIEKVGCSSRYSCCCGSGRGGERDYAAQIGVYVRGRKAYESPGLNNLQCAVDRIDRIVADIRARDRGDDRVVAYITAGRCTGTAGGRKGIAIYGSGNRGGKGRVGRTIGAGCISRAHG